MAEDATHWQSFWQELWLREDTPPFHLPQVNPHLIRHFPQLRLAPGARVLVPLCGKSVDLGWLASQGVTPVGVELSPQAAAAYYAEQNLTPQVSRLGPFERYEAGGVVILCGDFFELQPAMLAPFDAVYDRAALIALPIGLRHAYAATLARLLRPGGPLMLVALDYPQEQMQGPPFALTPAQVAELYPGWPASEWHRQDIRPQEPRFAARGLTRLEEYVLQLQHP